MFYYYHESIPILRIEHSFPMLTFASSVDDLFTIVSTNSYAQLPMVMLPECFKVYCPELLLYICKDDIEVKNLQVIQSPCQTEIYQEKIPPSDCVIHSDDIKINGVTSCDHIAYMNSLYGIQKASSISIIADSCYFDMVQLFKILQLSDYLEQDGVFNVATNTTTGCSQVHPEGRKFLHFFNFSNTIVGKPKSIFLDNASDEAIIGLRVRDPSNVIGLCAYALKTNNEQLLQISNERQSRLEFVEHLEYLRPGCCEENFKKIALFKKGLMIRYWNEARFSVHEPRSRRFLASMNMLRYTLKLENGVKKRKRLNKVCVLTLVLNGMPFLHHHLFTLKRLSSEYNIDWEWHVVEGVATKRANRHRPYSTQKIPNRFYNESTGMSIDGTTEFLDQAQSQFPNQIFLHRRNQWNDKLEMSNEGISTIRTPCILIQIDADELWSIEQLSRAAQLPENIPCAYVDCHFFVSPEIVTIHKGPHMYSHDDELEWLRLWRYEPGMIWLSHAPPMLSRWTSDGWETLSNNKCANHDMSNKLRIGFTHYAYVMAHQVSFKQHFYGYYGALEKWNLLRSQSPPVDISLYFSWVNSEKGVTGHRPVWADYPHNSHVGTSIEIVPFPRRKRMVVDGVVFSMKQQGGIARVWYSLVQHLSRYFELTVLIRGELLNDTFLNYSIVFNIPNVRYETIRDYDMLLQDADDEMLNTVCKQLQADVFLSTLYTRAPSFPNVLFIHDMIPELFQWDASLPEWQAKHRAMNTANIYIVPSKSTEDNMPKSEKLVMRLTPAIDVDIFRPILKPRFENFWLFVGPRNGYKNGHVFFESLGSLVAQAKKQGIDAGNVVFVGGATPSSDEIHLSELQGVRLTHLVAVKDNDLAVLYSQANALVYLSAMEGFGLPVLEGMACKCPVVMLYRNSGTREVVGDIAPFSSMIIRILFMWLPFYCPLSRMFEESKLMRDIIRWLVSTPLGN